MPKLFNFGGPKIKHNSRDGPKANKRFLGMQNGIRIPTDCENEKLILYIKIAFFSTKIKIENLDRDLIIII